MIYTLTSFSSIVLDLCNLVIQEVPAADWFERGRHCFGGGRVKCRGPGDHVEHHGLIPRPLIDPVHAVGRHPWRILWLQHHGMVLADEHRVASQVRHRVPAWPALGVVLEDEDVVFHHVPPHLVQVTAEEEDMLDACELGRGVVGRGVGGGGVEREAGALGQQGFNDGPPSLSLGDVEHVHVSQQGDAVDLAVVVAVRHVD